MTCHIKSGDTNFDIVGMESEDFPEELSTLLSQQMQQFEFEVSNEVIDEDTATVDVKITTINIGKAFEDSINEFMEKAIELAKKADKCGEVPIGAVVVYDGKIISHGFNKREKSKNAINHAEMIAISKACKKMKDWI